MTDTFTLKEKIGQLFIVGFGGVELSGSITKLIKQSKIGGVILFTRNYTDIAQLIKLVNDLQTCSIEYQGIPLFISVDQEGGRVSRFGPPFTQFPPCADLGARFQSNQTKTYASTLARELKICGINMNYAPVLDVLTNSKNEVIGDRAFSSDPDLVAFHGNIVIREFVAQNIVPVGKHFPGHGGTLLDSHIELPEVETEMGQLKSIETEPFQKAIANNLEVIMTAHVKYNKIDPIFPATFSNKILTGLLKEELGFKGLVISDDLEMSAITKYYADEEIPALAVEAGVDCLLVCHSAAKQHAFISSLEIAVKKNILREEIIQNSYNKIIALKNKCLIPYIKANYEEAKIIFYCNYSGG